MLVAVLLTVAGASAQKFEGLADTPPMGWNSWNGFGCDIDENMIREVVDAIVETGLADAGYVYINLDDCWHAAERDADGFVRCDPQRFPSGIEALADYVHSKGLKLGIYSDAGRSTCAGRVGSLGHEYQDALQYARWGVDYLKYDWCDTEDINPAGAYRLMRDALRAAGRPVLFSMCEWGQSSPWEWAADVGHMWRTTGDIGLSFRDDIDHGSWRSLSVLSIIDLQEKLRRYAGPGHWNDPDMLEVGNGLSFAEDRAHFTMWCMLAAPLILGNDIRTMSDETLSILLNDEAIAVDQDPLGVQGLKLTSQDGIDVWFKPLQNGDWAFCLLNRNDVERRYRIDWPTLEVSDDEVSGRSTDFARTEYAVRDLWSGTDEGSTRSGRTVAIAAHDVVLYRLTPTE